MNSMALHLVLAGVAGLALGLFYFGGLWFTVKRINRSRRPVIFLLGSFVIRLLVILCGLFLVMDGDLLRLLVCVGGFFLMRAILTRRLGPSGPESHHSVPTGG